MVRNILLYFELNADILPENEKKYIYPQFSKSIKSSSKITTLTNTTYLPSPKRRQKSKKNDTEDEPFTSFHKFRPRSVFS